MRFATKGRSIDMEKTEAQILRAIELGVNYLDTAYIYPGSEEALGKIIEKHDLRDKITLTTKASPGFSATILSISSQVSLVARR